MRLAVTEFTTLSPRRTAPRPLFAIGDIHGHAAALEPLLEHLDRVISAEYGSDPVDLVHLGDFIDRGPDPLGVLALARRGLGRASVRERTLMGNHDWFLIAAARLKGQTLGLDEWAVWLRNGGRETLEALGGLSYMTARPERLVAALGPENVAFLEGLELTARFGDILCVHAGVDPMLPLEDQRMQDLIWIREPFLEPAEIADGPWLPGVTVVHGHTPSAYGIKGHRIGVDTGGFSTGVFSAVEIREGSARFHHLIVDDDKGAFD